MLKVIKIEYVISYGICGAGDGAGVGVLLFEEATFEINNTKK